MSFFEELKRRNVFRVGIAYLITGWLLAQVADLFLENFGAPDWVMKTILLVIVIGFPLALIFAWAFEMTSEGIKREKDVDRSQSITPNTGRKLDRAIIVLLALGLGYFAWESRFSDRTATPVDETETVAEVAKSIAVLPFADLSQAGDQEWFADGLAEEILNALARTPDLLVSSRTSSFKYKGSSLDIPEIAQELGVAHVLEGSVRSGGGRIRVTAQLIRASDGFHVWSENYDRDVADMISIQEDLARNIAQALETTMDPAALAEMTEAGTRSVEAYQQYLRGLDLETESFFEAEGRTTLLRAYEYYEQARATDPQFAAAHWRAAEFWATQLSPTRTDSGATDLAPLQMLEAFNQRIDAAIDSAPNTTERLRYLASKAFLELRLNEAIDLYSEYLEARPNDDLARENLVFTAMLASRTDLLQQWLTYLKPRVLTDLSMAGPYANNAHRIISPAEAADVGMQILERWPNSSGNLYQVHRTLLWARRFDDAREVAARFLRLNDGRDVILQARQACADGDRAKVETLLSQVDFTQGDGLSEKWHLLMLLDRKQEAVELLRPVEESGVPYQLVSWLVYAQFDPSPFPSVMAVLKREGVKRPPPVELPFKCPPPTQPSIAVLPFRDMSAAQDQAYFGEGIAEELLNALVKLDGLKVASRTSAFSLADEDLDIPSIAERLGVNHILEGSIRTSGQQVRVTAQLIEVSEDVHLWSETYDGTLDDIFQIQDEITAKITAAMKLQFGDGELVSTAEELTDNAEAYQLYLQGRHFWRQRNAPALENAVRLFKRAVELDPEFHQAWSNLGVAYVNLPDYDHNYEIAETNQLGLAAADRALALNPASTEARIIRAAALEYSCDVTTGAREYEAAIAGDPNDPTARHWYSIVLLAAGKTRQALEQIEAGRRIDPLISAATVINAWVLGALERTDEAIQLAREAAALGFRGGATDSEGALLIMASRVKEGATLIRQAAAQEQDADRRRVLELFAQAAEDPQKQGELETFIGRAADTHPFTAAEILDLLVALGSPYVFTYLEGVECPVLGQNFWYPLFREQRGTPEFFELMERTGYVDYWREFGWPDDCASLDQSLAECPQ